MSAAVVAQNLRPSGFITSARATFGFVHELAQHQPGIIDDLYPQVGYAADDPTLLTASAVTGSRRGRSRLSGASNEHRPRRSARIRPR